MNEHKTLYAGPDRGKAAIEALSSIFDEPSQPTEQELDMLRTVLQELNPGAVVQVQGFPDGRVRIMVASPDHGLSLG
jgi:hypothetical protein